MQNNQFGAPDPHPDLETGEEEELQEDEEEEYEEEDIIEEDEEIEEPSPNETFVASKEDLFPMDPFKQDRLVKEAAREDIQPKQTQTFETPSPPIPTRDMPDLGMEDRKARREARVTKTLRADFCVHLCATFLLCLMLGGAAAVVVIFRLEDDD